MNAWVDQSNEEGGGKLKKEQVSVHLVAQRKTGDDFVLTVFGQVVVEGEDRPLSRIPDWGGIRGALKMMIMVCDWIKAPITGTWKLGKKGKKGK